MTTATAVSHIDLRKTDATIFHDIGMDLNDWGGLAVY